MTFNNANCIEEIRRWPLFPLIGQSTEITYPLRMRSYLTTQFQLGTLLIVILDILVERCVFSS
jgi:hypothetical protein